MNDTTAVVDAIGKIHLEGNIVPASWYKHLRTKDNKADFVAITILSDIVYWYRPTEIRDEQTGLVIGYKKKFAADKLQRSYDQLADQFSISKEQARDACHRLRDAGLITVEIRHGVRYGQGMIANNVVYLEPVAEAILEVSYRVTQGDSAKQPAPPSNVDTNTEITTKTSTYPPGETLEGKTLYFKASNVLQNAFEKYGGTVNGSMLERLRMTVENNIDHPAERLDSALKKLSERRNFYRAIDAYREWTPPSVAQKSYSTPYRKPEPVSTLRVRTD